MTEEVLYISRRLHWTDEDLKHRSIEETEVFKFQ